MDEVENFFLPISKPLSGMGGYTSKCEKKSKSLHPIAHALVNQMAMKRLRAQLETFFNAKSNFLYNF
jgi:hypothetical protein